MKKTIFSVCLFSVLSIPVFAQWNTGGNIVAPGEFLGSTNPADVLFKTNGNPVMTLENSGHVRIPKGSLALSNFGPSARLEVFAPQNTQGIILNSEVCSTPLCIAGTALFQINRVNSSNNVLQELLHVIDKGNVGIGTGSPMYKLHIDKGDIGIDDGYKLRSNQYANDYLQMKQAQFSFVARGKTMFFIDELFGSIPDVINIGDGSDINTTIFANGGSKAIFVEGATGNVGIGTINPLSPIYKLSVNGGIRAKEVVVETGWADFVFENSYKLMPLQDVETFIKENKHLPGIPSAEEISTNGLKVGEGSTLMMQKIEELTLYMIELKKELEAIKKENSELKSKK